MGGCECGRVWGWEDVSVGGCGDGEDVSVGGCGGGEG